MGLLRSIVALILNTLFPSGYYYKLLTEVEVNEDTSMTADRSYETTAGSPHSPVFEPQPRRRTCRGSRADGEAASNRRSWIQSLGVEQVQKFMRPGRSTTSRREERKTRGESHRNSPNLPKVEETTRVQPPPQLQIDRSKRLFQDKLDECSETDVIRQCQSLNEKINNIAFSLVDEWTQAPSIPRRFLLYLRSDSDDTSNLQSIIGNALYNAIKHARSSPPSDDIQRLVTDTLQTSAIAVTAYIISTLLSPGLSRKSNGEMHGVFRNMLRNEPLASALRWRALAYKHSTTSLNPSNTQYQEALSGNFQAIFITAGERNSSNFLARIPAAVKASDIIESALVLSEMLKTKVFSVLLDVYAVPSGMYFREDTMDVDSKKSTRNRRVLCTLELGLHEVTPQFEQARILLKPKVALEE